MMYILKIKGTEKIPDFVQIRNAEMSLIAYFRLDQMDVGIDKNDLTKNKKEIIKRINTIPFGKVSALEIHE